MRRRRFQRGSLRTVERKDGTTAWEFRWREIQADGTRTRRAMIVGTLEEYPTESAALAAVEGLCLTINQPTHQLARSITIDSLVKHYREQEMPDIFHKRKPEGEAPEDRKAYSTQYAYELYLKHWILPLWGTYQISDVKAVEVEAWLRSLHAENGSPLANGTKAKIRNVMSALFSHAIRWEWAEKNPITRVRQSAKRQTTPDILTPEELVALLKELPEPLRTAAELDAFTGLRRGELIGLQWQDVDFEDLVIHVRRSVVLMVQGNPKTEASRKDIPLDAELAESLLRWKLASVYCRDSAWLFASPKMKGKQPYWPETLWRRLGKPAVARAKIKKRVAWHTFRHTYTTLLKNNGEDVKVVQELLRHANIRVTMDVYAQAMMPAKRAAQTKLVRMVLQERKHEGENAAAP